MTREKAAYWLYCAHIWVNIDPDAALHFDIEEPEVSQRDQWQDMNSLGRGYADSLEFPWERQLCSDLNEVGELLAHYDGTAAMDAQINAILDGRCYAAVAFCLAQRSFATEKSLMETDGGRFRPKERICLQTSRRTMPPMIVRPQRLRRISRSFVQKSTRRSTHVAKPS